jgi:hypothetical protein
LDGSMSWKGYAFVVDKRYIKEARSWKVSKKVLSDVICWTLFSQPYTIIFI